MNVTKNEFSSIWERRSNTCSSPHPHLTLPTPHPHLILTHPHLTSPPHTLPHRTSFTSSSPILNTKLIMMMMSWCHDDIMMSWWCRNDVVMSWRLDLATCRHVIPSWRHVAMTKCRHDDMPSCHAVMKTCRHDKISSWRHAVMASTSSCHDDMTCDIYVVRHDDIKTWRHDMSTWCHDHVYAMTTCRHDVMTMTHWWRWLSFLNEIFCSVCFYLAIDIIIYRFNLI